MPDISAENEPMSCEVPIWVKMRFKRLGRFERGWSRRVVIKYILLQLPGVMLAALLIIAAWRWFDFSVWFVYLVIVVFVAKDVVLFPFVWRAYDQGSPDGMESMIDFNGIAEERMAPEGYVRVRGELWHARVTGSKGVIEKGMRVRVVSGSGLTLAVEPDPLKDDEAIQNFDNDHKT